MIIDDLWDRSLLYMLKFQKKLLSVIYMDYAALVPYASPVFSYGSPTQSILGTLRYADYGLRLDVSDSCLGYWSEYRRWRFKIWLKWQQWETGKNFIINRHFSLYYGNIFLSIQQNWYMIFKIKNVHLVNNFHENITVSNTNWNFFSFPDSFLEQLQ